MLRAGFLCFYAATSGGRSRSGFCGTGWSAGKSLDASDEFALKLKEALDCDAIRYTPTDRPIRKIAFCCGGGASDFEKVVNNGFDAFITSDVKHNHFIDAVNTNTALFVPTHYQMEKPAMQGMASLLKQSFPEAEVIISEAEKEPSKIV